MDDGLGFWGFYTVWVIFEVLFVNFPRVKAKTLLILPPAAGENLSKKKKLWNNRDGCCDGSQEEPKNPKD